MEIEGYLLGSPPPVGPSFGWPPPLFGARLTPSSLPSLPPHSPALSPHSQWPSEDRGMLYYVFPTTQKWGQGARGELGARGSEGGEMNVILGFRVSTTSGRINFDDDI